MRFGHHLDNPPQVLKTCSGFRLSGTLPADPAEPKTPGWYLQFIFPIVTINGATITLSSPKDRSAGARNNLSARSVTCCPGDEEGGERGLLLPKEEWHLSPSHDFVGHHVLQLGGGHIREHSIGNTNRHLYWAEWSGWGWQGQSRASSGNTSPSREEDRGQWGQRSHLPPLQLLLDTSQGLEPCFPSMSRAVYQPGVGKKPVN